MPTLVTVADDNSARIAVRCPVCNLPLIRGEPAGHFVAQCVRHSCRTLVEVIINAPMAPLLERPKLVRTSESGPCLP
jgi:phage FluMu protein Com